MKKDDNQLDLNFKEVHQENTNNKAQQYPKKAERRKIAKPDFDNFSLSEESLKSKVKADSLKAPQGLEVKTASDDNSEGALLFDNLITVEELAVIFGLAPQTIRNWVALGKLPYVKIGRRNMFLERSLQKWLNRKEEPQWR